MPEIWKRKVECKLTILSVELAEPYEGLVTVSVKVPDRDGEPVDHYIGITSDLEVPDDIWPLDHQLAARIVQVVMSVIEHEICETLYVDGRRVLDPHVGQRRPLDAKPGGA